MNICQQFFFISVYRSSFSPNDFSFSQFRLHCQMESCSKYLYKIDKEPSDHGYRNTIH